MPRFADPLLKAAAYFLLANDACVPLRTCWCKRLPIRVQQFDKNPALPIGPPAWHLNRSVRYLLMEVEAFERKARVTWPPPTGRPLSESSPTAREDAIEQMMQKRPERRDRGFYSAKDVVDITGLPGYWIHQNQERLRLGIPFYRIANGDVIRFSIEEIFLWEMHHLRPCRYPARGNADAP